ncbi:dynactin-associated protein [Vicugna pacos]|uniref:Dynactin-associated protein n=1 Tax=Vicugna pacos TaxID=30538 RepID=A0A6J3BPX6_VICPA
MNRKLGKYAVNIEHSENQAPVTCSNDQAQSSVCWRPPSNGVTGDVPSSLTGVCMNPGVLAQSGYPHTDLSHAQVKENSCNNGSLWKVFLACLLACVITTAIGVLIICLVNKGGNGSPCIIIQVPTMSRGPAVTTPGTTATTSQPTVTTSSAGLTATTTSTESTTSAASTENIATATTSAAPTTSSERTATAATTTTSSETTAAPTSPEPTSATTGYY